MIKRLGGRILALLPVIVIQVVLIYLLFSILAPFSTIINVVLTALAIVLSIYIISKQEVDSYKQVWIFFILLLPIVGSVVYLLFGNKKTGAELRKKIDKAKEKLNYRMPKSDYIYAQTAQNHEIRAVETVFFGSHMTGMELYKNSSDRYYPLGEDMMPDLLADLEKAEKYIFIEYFIVEKGIFWDSIVDVLKRKVKDGVDVRVMYDDLGSIMTYKKKNRDELISCGIKCMAFNPIKYITLKINNRDHRKMTVIDGKIAYSGGVNIADEYINKKKVYGHWKDIGFRIEGDAVISYAYMFTEFWNAFSKDEIPASYLTEKCSDEGENGYIFSYCDSPVHSDHVCNTLYIELLSQATKYIWFYTPYLLLDSSLNEALIRTARRGVDVRIITPGIPDKKTVYRISRSYYGPLLKAGVRIFEYTPGFVHAKAAVCDDSIASIGTSNLDFRSLFLHFECNSIFINSTAVNELKKDYEDTLTKCLERKADDKLPGTKYGIIDSILRLIAPLC